MAKYHVTITVDDLTDEITNVEVSEELIPGKPRVLAGTATKTKPMNVTGTPLLTAFEGFTYMAFRDDQKNLHRCIKRSNCDYYW